MITRRFLVRLCGLASVLLILGLTAPASGQTPLPNGLEIALLPGFTHEQLRGDDSFAGRFAHEDGLEIYYVMGPLRPAGEAPISGDFTNQALRIPEGDRLWLKEQDLGGRQVHVAYTKERRLIVSSASTTEGVNFMATAETPSDVADVLLMVLSLASQKARQDP